MKDMFPSDAHGIVLGCAFNDAYHMMLRVRAKTVFRGMGGILYEHKSEFCFAMEI